MGVKIFILDFLILRLSESPGPSPPFENPAHATVYSLVCFDNYDCPSSLCEKYGKPR